MDLEAKLITSEYNSRLDIIKKHAETLFKKDVVFHPYYTLHGIEHSRAIISGLNRLVDGIDSNNMLTDPEIFYLLASAYLHDAGMLISHPEDEAEAKIISKQKNEPYVREDIIRDKHNLRSGEYILEHQADLTLDRFESTIVKLICEGHRVVDLSSKEYNDKLLVYNRIRVRLLASLLKFSDELDVSYQRAPKEIMVLINQDMSEYSKIQWLKHYYASGLIPSLQESNGIKKVIIEIQTHYPNFERGEKITEKLIVGPIAEKLKSVCEVFLVYGLKVVINPPEIIINENLEEFPKEIYEKIFGVELFPSPCLSNSNSLKQKEISLNESPDTELYDHALEIKPNDCVSLIHKAFDLENIGKNEEATKIFDFISRKQNEIKDEEIIKIANFKKNALKEKEIDKKIDVLNEVINVFQEKSDDFFRNMNDIEFLFKKFIDPERSIPLNFCSFLSVFGKNKYTIPTPLLQESDSTGGYFLYHKGKGIVIDPGSDFIENFYHEGFKVADIDAVLITNPNRGITCLESILNLAYKYNCEIIDSIRSEMVNIEESKIKKEVKKRIEIIGKKIDLFLNMETFMKCSGWLNLKTNKEVNNLTLIMPNSTYLLDDSYHGIKMYTTKSKNHGIIDDQYAFSLVLDVDGIKIGFTGDTGWDWDRNEMMVKPFIEHKPRLVVAHLGSINRKEFDYVKATSDDEKNKCFYRHHLGLLGITKFLDVTRPDLTIISEFGEELRGMRKPIVERIGKVLELKCLPGDIGLHIRLSDLGVYCFIEEDFVDYKLINVYSDDSERGSTLCFHRSEQDHEIFNKALVKKQRSISIPFFKRMKPHESPDE